MYKCATCSKHFKSIPFFITHVQTKHRHGVDDTLPNCEDGLGPTGKEKNACDINKDKGHHLNVELSSNSGPAKVIQDLSISEQNKVANLNPSSIGDTEIEDENQNKTRVSRRLKDKEHSINFNEYFSSDDDDNEDSREDEYR